MSKSKSLGRVELTNRGFEFIEFKDICGETCSLQQSSIALCATPGASAVWLGVDSQTATPGRMHLDRKQVAALVSHLSAWLENGSLRVRNWKS